MRTRERGFTLIEVSLIAGLGVLMAGIALPAYQHQVVKARRVDGTAVLTRLMMAQEQHRNAHGLYATQLPALRGLAAARSDEGLYTIELQARPDGYTALAHATGPQSIDRDCATLTLTVDEGFASHGPDAKCWGR